MTAQAKKLLAAARALSEGERIRLAEQLLASVETADPAKVAAAWDAEIRRRDRELETGAVQAIPWPEARRRLRAARGRR